MTVRYKIYYIENNNEKQNIAEFDFDLRNNNLQEKASIINMITRRPYYGHVTWPGNILHTCHSLRLHTEMKK